MAQSLIDFSQLRDPNIGGRFMEGYDAQRARQLSDLNTRKMLEEQAYIQQQRAEQARYAQEANTLFANPQGLMRTVSPAEQARAARLRAGVPVMAPNAGAEFDQSTYQPTQEIDTDRLSTAMMKNPLLREQGVKMFQSAQEKREAEKAKFLEGRQKAKEKAETPFKIEEVGVGDGNFQQALVLNDGSVKLIGSPYSAQEKARRAAASAGGQRGVLGVSPEGMAYNLNPYTNSVTPYMLNGQPFKVAAWDEGAQAKIASSKKEGAAIGEARGTAVSGLQKAVDESDKAFKALDEISKHPGFKSYIGATLRPGFSYIDGTPEADFKVRLKELTGGAFLQAFQALKGGGAITEIEGTKATEAIARMSKATSEKEFNAAMNDYRTVIQKGVQRIRGTASQSVMGAGAAGAKVPTTQSGATVGNW
jgi:hypothetical protein